MKKLSLASLAGLALLTTASANAADIGPAYKAPPPVVAAPVPWTWTGFYIGAHIGGGWGTKEWTAVPGEVTGANDQVITSGAFPLAQTDVHGFLGGPTAGFNYQVDRWVFGVEGQFSWTDIKGNSGCTGLFF
jgi:outer membrane immunogenic protein